MTIAPTLTGDTLRLRAHVMADFDAFRAFFKSPRAAHMDVPRNRAHLWYGFASEVGSWSLTGMGGWAIEMEGALAGQVAITHPPHFAETELGWLLFDGFEGQGLAFEAATLALTYARDVLKPPSLVSYIDASNVRSIALARRLGATQDAAAARHDAGDVLYRHAVAA